MRNHLILSFALFGLFAASTAMAEEKKDQKNNEVYVCAGAENADKMFEDIIAVREKGILLDDEKVKNIATSKGCFSTNTDKLRTVGLEKSPTGKILLKVGDGKVTGYINPIVFVGYLEGLIE